MNYNNLTKICISVYIFQSANVEAQCAGVLEDNTRLSTTSQGYVLPEGKIMPNTVFVGGIDIRVFIYF